MRYHLIPVRMAINKKSTTINAGEDVEKREPSYNIGGIRAGAATVETCMEAPQKLKIELPDDPSSLVAQSVKSLPAMQETRVRSLGWEDLLENGMTTYSSILYWKIPMDRGAWQATVHGVMKELGTTEQLTPQTSLVPWKLCLILTCPRITPKFKKTSLETDLPPTPWPFLHNLQCISLHFFAFTITISGFGAMSSTLTMPQTFLGRVRECL